MFRPLDELWHSEDGSAATEYALLLSAGALASVAAWEQLGDTVVNTVTAAAELLESVSDGG